MAQRYGQEHATHQCPAGFLVWPQSALKPASWAFISMQTRGVGLKNSVPYLQMGLSTLVSRVSRRPEEKRTSFNQSIPRRFYSLASRHSTSVLLFFFACKTQISPSVCINGLPYNKMESSDIACAPERGDGQKNREQVLTSRYPQVFLVWLTAIALPVYIPVQKAKYSIGLHKGPPIPRNGILKLGLRIRTSHKDVDKSMQSTNAPQVFLFGHKAHQDCFRFFFVFFSRQMRGVGLKNGVPYLQMGLSTLTWRVSRRPEEHRTCFN